MQRDDAQREVPVHGSSPFPLAPAQVKAVLFDAVGTLLHANPPVAEAYADVGRKHGCLLPAEEIRARTAAAMKLYHLHDGVSSPPLERARWQSVVREVFRELPCADGPLFEELWQHFAQPTAWQLADDAGEVLAALSAAGYTLGIASNFDERLVPVCRGFAELKGVSLFWSSDLGHAKPHPSFFRAVEARLHLAPHEILLVGDDYQADYLGAHTAGWQALFLDPHRRFPAVPGIRSLREVLTLLDDDCQR